MAYESIKKEDLHLKDRIGSGGFSTVFQATVQSQEVAAKRLHEPDQHEVEVLATLDHPNIVKLIGIVRDNLDLYLVLELCKGGSLRSYLDQKRSENKRLPTGQVYDWAKQAAKPIQYLQQRNLVHKDIKSPNYLIAEGNILKLADFGITKNIEGTMQNATQRASPAWSSPELLKDNVLSPSYDISAYGVVVWELCTTLVPFEGSESHHIIWRICYNKERPSIPTDCPKPLADLMRQCWEEDWHKRPSADHILVVVSLAQKHSFFFSFFFFTFIIIRKVCITMHNCYSKHVAPFQYVCWGNQVI